MSASPRPGPSRPRRSSDEAWAEYLYFNANPKGEAPRDLAAPDLHGILRHDARHGDQRRPRQRTAEGCVVTAFRLARRRRGRSRPAARLHLRRQAARRVQGRQHRLGAACGRRPHRRPQLQISPAARDLGRLDRGAERDRRRDAPRPHDAEPPRHHGSARQRSFRALGQFRADRGARSRRADRQALGLHALGLLLQDLHLAALGDVRAPGPRPWPASEPSIRSIARRPKARRSTPAATCSSSAPALPASPRRARPRERARSCSSSRIMTTSAARSSIAAERSKAATGAHGRTNVRAAVEAAGGRVMTSTTAFGIYDHNLVCAWERRAPRPDALWRIRPKRIVVAAGAIERPLTVPDNDRPGVMSADAALVYLRRYGIVVGKRVAIATNNDQRLSGRRSAGGSRGGGRDFRLRGRTSRRRSSKRRAMSRSRA